MLSDGMKKKWRLFKKNRRTDSSSIETSIRSRKSPDDDEKQITAPDDFDSAMVADMAAPKKKSELQDKTNNKSDESKKRKDAPNEESKSDNASNSCTVDRYECSKCNLVIILTNI